MHKFILELLPLESALTVDIVEVPSAGTKKHCYKVRSPSGQLFVKRAGRVGIEALGMDAYRKVMPHVVPRVLGKDSGSSLFATELLDEDYVTLQSLLEGGRAVDRDISTNVGTSMGRSHARSHAAITTAEQKARYSAIFGNEAAMETSNQTVFVPTIALLESADGQDKLLALGLDARAVRDMASAASLLLQTFCDKKDALVHGDLLATNILVCPDGLGPLEERCKLVDFEHCGVGAPGLDLGAYLGNLIYYYVAHSLGPSRRDIKEGIYATLSAYRSAFRVQLEGAIQQRAPSAKTVDIEGLLDGIVCDALGFSSLRLLHMLVTAPERNVLSMEATPGYRWGDIQGRELSVRRRHLRALHGGLSRYLRCIEGGPRITIESILEVLAADDALLNSDHQTEFW